MGRLHYDGDFETMQLVDQLCVLLMESGRTINSIADEADVSRRMAYYIVEGKAVPNVAVVIRLLKVLGYSLKIQKRK